MKMAMQIGIGHAVRIVALRTTCGMCTLAATSTAATRATRIAVPRLVSSLNRIICRTAVRQENENIQKNRKDEDISTTQIYLDLSEDELVQAHRKYVV